MKSILNFKVFLGAFFFAILLLGATLAYFVWIQPNGSTPAPSSTASGQVSGSAFAVLTIIPAPTSTPTYVIPTLTPTPDAALITATPTPLPGAYAVGVYVQISGTEGQGLHLRAQPGLNNAALFLGYDAEVYKITDGPVQANGYTWWYLTAPYDQARSGWAVQDYLSVIPSP
jgi:hypothetical protein